MSKIVMEEWTCRRDGCGVAYVRVKLRRVVNQIDFAGDRFNLMKIAG